jgi:NodT family efflux transporter outer membrane factor (OMF) lipoprotein
MMKLSVRVGLITLAAAVAGCTVGPNYKEPATPVPPAYGSAPATQPSASVAWWTLFNDDVLNRLVNDARQSNLDLRQANARILEARAARGFVTSQNWPSIDAFGNYTRTRNSKNIASGGFVPTENDFFQAGFDATWEIDIFGGIRRGVEAANADIQAAIADRNAVLMTLLGDVARSYMELRGAQRQIVIAEENIRAQQQTLELTRARLRAGLANDLDVARQEAQVNATSSFIPTLQTRAQQAIHRLSVLTARAPSDLSEQLGPPQPLPAPPPAVPVGLPSDLLRRRPDIRAAERSLAAATARVGIATADLYPRFTIVGQAGLESNHFKNWGDSSSSFWSLGPGVTVPIFNAGRIRSNIAIERARTDQALANYERTVLNSLAEVEDALVAYQKEFTRRESLAAAVAANTRSVNLSQQLYQQGLRDFLNVLDAQRALFESQDALAASDTQVSANAVALFKALGGGWEVDPGGQNPQASAR